MEKQEKSLCQQGTHFREKQERSYRQQETRSQGAETCFSVHALSATCDVWAQGNEAIDPTSV